MLNKRADAAQFQLRARSLSKEIQVNKKGRYGYFTEFAFRLETSYKRWIHSLNVTKFEELKQVVLID